jgi:5-methylcytosine-specific restriction endonuclease McrA
MTNAVFVLGENRKPLKPVHPAVARRMLDSGQAAVFRRYPFTIICKPGIRTGEAENVRLKLDPGSKTSGIALLMHDAVIWAAELTHRGQRIKAALDARRALRRGRRNRQTRYRKPRFDNRTRPEGWLPPSLMHRVQTTMTWVQRLCRYAPVEQLSVENVRFDTQAMQNPEISGTEYQQGELAGYEVREYLLEKFSRTCAYCGAKDTPLEVEHIVPKSRGGSDRVSNLTIACVPCNQAKDNQTAEEFGHPEVQARARMPLRDAAAVNATRWCLYNALVATGLPVEAGTGGRTKYNRTRQKLPKTHWLDAACVGASTPDALRLLTTQPLLITCKGRGSRQMCRTDKYGFPSRHLSHHKRHFGFQTGDLVRAEVPKGKYAGRHVGRVTVRPRGSFNLGGRDINHQYCRLIQRTDGYDYAHGSAIEASPCALLSPSTQA